MYGHKGCVKIDLYDILTINRIFCPDSLLKKVESSQFDVVRF